MTNIFSDYGYDESGYFESISKQKKANGVLTGDNVLIFGKGIVDPEGNVSVPYKGTFDSIREQNESIGYYDNTVIEYGKGVIPSGGKTSKYLTFTANENDSSVGFAQDYNETPVEYNIQYKKTGDSDWTDYTIGNEDDGDIVMIDLNEGESVMFKGINPNGFYNVETDEHMYCVIDGTVAASGDITSLLNGVGGDCALPANCFHSFFVNCEGLTTAPELPATTLAEGCYSYMFQNCTSLTTAPELPATTLADYCYSNMFNNCTSLTTAPDLPATTLTEECYAYMFENCTGLTTAPELPSTTLAVSCYSGIFGGCTSLTTAPELPATTLAEGCYSYMFQNCTSLTTAPELPATTLAVSCYTNMFNGCNNLSSITCLATDISATECTHGWLSGVSEEGTFIKAASMSDWKEGSNGIPENWTVEDYSE